MLTVLLIGYMLFLSYRDIKYKEIEDIYLLVLCGLALFINKDDLELSLVVFASVFTGAYFVVMIIMNIIYYYKKWVMKIKDIDTQKLGFYIGEADMIIIAALSVLFINNGEVDYFGIYLLINISLVGVGLYSLIIGKIKKIGSVGLPMIPFILFGLVVALKI